MAVPLTSVRVDVERTFAALLFLKCEPKREFGSDRQAVTKAGELKWEVELLAAVRDGFGGTTSQVMTVGMVAKSDPAAGIAPLKPVDLPGLEVGFMPKVKRLPDGSEKPIPGISVWARASEIVLQAETVVAAGTAA